MPFKTIKHSLLAILLLCSTSAALAQNSLFLRDSPLASLTGAELNTLLIEIYTPVAWQTADGRLTSVWTVTKDYQKQDLSCRKMTLETTSNGETFSTGYGFCKIDKSWLFDLE